MAYADQEVSGNKIAAFVVVALLHLALGYALVTGLAYEGLKQVVKKVTTVDIKKDEPKKEPPPPPKKMAAAPPIVAPPPKINVSNVSPPVETVQTVTPQPPPPVYVAPPAPVAAPPPPPPKFTPKAASPKGASGNWVTTNDYPTRALREEREGVTGYRLSIGPDGRVTDCSITSSSGSPDLDEATCSNLRRRARFNPATDGEGNPTSGSFSARVRWVIPKE
ncbi:MULTISPECIES: energy transducer TonB [unclassified Novosphingobium]|uniref:energy transducer TonB n=1 Tax=unclassified Novosphingobium TaxID=2644732 RepID=UPI000EC18C33|nr:MULTISPECIES: energy transducer TonB [unclassified Novosphingobium]HCF25282.1 energy transducer TonB [Novosphingobium sp.]HQV02550.1 energy transducer TonB [Novosphingobium sp.]